MSRSDPAPIKIICLGLGRTGTTSLRVALEKLNFGPCYRMSAILRAEGKDFAAWRQIGEGNGTPESFDELFRGYGVVMDYPAAMYAEELYAAYPDAKFILTTRDPSVWEKSVKTTLLQAAEILNEKAVRTGFEGPLHEWLQTDMLGKYHGGRLYTHAQQEILDHNERVKKIIPPEKLLVFEVREGWDKLVEFLGVSKPLEPFPHLNDTAAFEKDFLQKLRT